MCDMPKPHALTRVHELALIKGAVEGDSDKHFASLFGIPTHARPLLNLELLVDAADGYGYDATEAGKAFYDTHQLASLPDGRANNWGSHPIAVAASTALDELEAAAARSS